MSQPVRKALVVDDDTAIRRIVAVLLKNAGYETLEAENGDVATRLILEHQPHIVITDWEMPELDGPGLCKWIRAANLRNYTYVIVLTVRSDVEDLIHSLNSGADDFVRKPIDRDELTARIRAGERVLALEQRLSLLATQDALTGLPTRATFLEQMSKEWSRSVRHNVPLTCVMLDIDFFKRINDTYGHPAGDEVIRQVAHTLSAGIRTADTVGRYGGEEFCILLPETTEAQAHIWADRIRRRIGMLRFSSNGVELQCTASLGFAQRKPDTKNADELIDMADQALLVAKRSGRDRAVSFTSLNQMVNEQLDDFSPEKLFRGLPARDVMTAVVTGLNQDELIGSAVEFFLRFRISSAPVVDADGKLVGILSEKDAMAVMLCNGWWNSRVKDVMKANVVCYEETTPALQIYEFLCRVTIRTAVIVKDGRPTGLINRGGLLRWFANSAAVLRDDDPNAEEHPTRFPQPREQLLATANVLSDETSRLADRLEMADRDDVSGCVIGGASRIQELVNDLLIFSRHLTEQPKFADDGSSESGSSVTGLAGLLDSLSADQLGALTS